MGAATPSTDVGRRSADRQRLAASASSPLLRPALSLAPLQPIATLAPLRAMMSGGGGGIPGGTSGLPSAGSTSSSSQPSPASFSLLSFIPHNPSIGLGLFSPIVPAADNRPALFLLTSVQFMMGMLLMTRRTPRIGESRLSGRFRSTVRFFAGSTLILFLGLEYARLALPYDPWADEARHWRHLALKNGQKPSWWFGGIQSYTPMTLSEWKTRTSIGIANTLSALEAEDNEDEAEVSPDRSLLTGIFIGPNATIIPGLADNHNDIYQHLNRINTKRTADLLAGELKDVTELNKAQRLDAILDHLSPIHYNEEYHKPNIQLGTHTMETDDDFEMVWANFEPWDELKMDTDFEVRLIPRWRGVDDVEA